MSGVTITSCARLQGVLAVLQEFRDDAGDAPAVIEHGVRDRAHQPARAAAIDEADAFTREDFAKRPRGFHVGAIGARTGPAIDANGSNRAHGADVASALWERQGEAKQAGTRKMGTPKFGLNFRRIARIAGRIVLRPGGPMGWR